MKAISVRQPWATAIVMLGKNIENRPRPWRYMGEVLIHASAYEGTRYEFHEACSALADILGRDAFAVFAAKYLRIADLCGDSVFRPAPDLPLGGVIGRARLDGCSKDRSELATSGADLRWWNGWSFGVVIRDVQPVPFFACKGALGLWECDYPAPPRASEARS